jgi:hypothetical protein
MIFTKFSLIISFICICFSAFSQANPSSSDTLKEVVVYEYDTVYLQPDTLRITETIVQIEKQAKDGEKPSAITQLFSRNFSRSVWTNIHLLGGRSFLAHVTPNYLSFGIAPYINQSGNAITLSDSFASKLVINTCFSLLWNYAFGNFVMSLGPGFIRYHDKLQMHTSRFSTDYQTSNSNTFDSILLTTNANSDLYYNYLKIYTLVGYKFTLNKKLSLLFNGGFETDILVGYKQGHANNPALAAIRKYDIHAVIYTSLAYKLARNLELYISPFYQRSLVTDNKYPFTNVQKIGVGMGFNLFLK